MAGWEKQGIYTEFWWGNLSENVYNCLNDREVYFRIILSGALGRQVLRIGGGLDRDQWRALASVALNLPVHSVNSL
jgi:hypothetical protein